MRLHPVERPDPTLPRAPGLRFERGIAHHAGELRVFGGADLLLGEEVRAGGGVRTRRLEILVGRHRVGPLVGPRATRPPAATPRGDAKVSSMPIRQYAPLCLQGPPLGEGRRGWA